MRPDLDIPRIEAIATRLRSEFPELADDETLRFDTIDGEAPLTEVLRHIVRQMAEADAYASGLDATIETMKARRDRFIKRVEYCRAMVERVMVAADQTKIPLPEATLSLRPSPPKVVIANDKIIPPEFLKTTIAPDKTAIRDALKDGQTIPGAFLSNGEPALSVRFT